MAASDMQIARRYAKALVARAEETGETERIRQDCADVARIIRQQPQLAAALQHPMLSESSRTNVMQELFQDKVSPTLYNFMQLLVQRRRLALLADCCEAFALLYRDARGILQATIRTPFELPAEQIDAIRTRLETRYGKTVETDVTLEPELLGGFTVQVGDVVHDFSIHGKLETLRKELCGVG